MAEVQVVFGSCVGMVAHGMVLTPDDDDFDVDVIGFEPPNEYQYGYCSRCGAPFRWEASKGWQDWDVPLTDRRRQLEASAFVVFERADIYSFTLRID